MRGSTNAQADLSSKQDTLTFDTVPTANSANPITSGGVYTALESAGGGEVWEEVDLTNFPTDWTEKDRFKIIFNVTPGASSVSSWTSKPSTAFINIDKYSTYRRKVLEFSLEGSVIDRTLINFKEGTNCLLFSDVGLNPASYFNGSGTIFSLYGFAFNAGGVTVSSVLNVTRSNLAQCVYKMWRLKQ